MKKSTLQKFFIVPAALIFFLVCWLIFPQSCRLPIYYHIGEIDQRFDIATSTVRERLREAEEVWESAVQRELFVYESGRGLEINFIFDERQQTTNEINQYESELAVIENSRDTVVGSYEQQAEMYEAAQADYQAAAEAYENDLAAYNRRVSTWHDRGGAPDDIHGELVAERAALGQRQEQLERDLRKLEQMRGTVNRLADQGNSLAETYNETAADYNRRFTDEHEFNQATYGGGEITVYQFDRSDDLRLALAHEFGHALGVGHVENPASLMYYLMGQQQLDPLQLTTEDRHAFAEVCGIDF